MFSDLLKETRDLPPEDGAPIFKFTDIGDSFVAKFMGRRTGIKTKAANGTATALDVEILASELRGDENPPTGPHTVFESTHISQLMDQQGLVPGDAFILRLASIDRKSRFKKFYFKRLSESDVATYSDDSPDDGLGDEWPGKNL
jgi:hypothetical protein